MSGRFPNSQRRCRVLHAYEPASAGVPRYVAALRTTTLPDVEQVAVGPAGPDVRLRPGRRTPRDVVGFHANVLRQVRRFDPDVVHLHSTFALPLAVALRRRRVVYSPHAWATWTQRGWRRSLVDGVHRLLMRGVDTIAALSVDERVEAVRLGADPDRVVVVGSTLVDGSSRPRLGESVERLVLFVGRTAVQKGDDLLGRIADELPDDVRLVAVGPLTGEYGERVEVVGAVGDVSTWYRRAAVLVQPSRYEGLSLVSVEAACHGVPIAGFDVPGMGWIRAASFGELVPCDDVAALAAVVRRLLSTTQADRARIADDAQAMFDSESWAQRLRHLYLHP